MCECVKGRACNRDEKEVTEASYITCPLNHTQRQPGHWWWGGGNSANVRKSGGSDIITNTSLHRFSSDPQRSLEGPHEEGNTASGWRPQVL